MSELRAVSMFSNCGAGDVGYRQAGFEFDVMAELDPRRLQVALLNHPSAEGVAGDLRETWEHVVDIWRRKHGDRRPDLLAACPPCQGMSSANGGRGNFLDHEAGGRDPRNLLVTVIARVVEELNPRAVVVENVQPFLTRSVPHPDDGHPISAALLLTEAVSESYAVYAMQGNLADWGVPQHRKRAFLTLLRRDEPGLAVLERAQRTPYPRPAHARDYGGRNTSIREALAELGTRSLDASREETARDDSDPLHFVPVWDDVRYRMVAAIPADSGLGAWASEACSECDARTEDAEAATCRSCGARLLRPVVKDKDGGWRLVRGFRTTSYTRMRADEPASTVTTASGHVGSDKTIHPWENRVLSVRECAHLQTFPSSFEWGDALANWGHTNVREMIGEAVPPAFTRSHGLAVRSVLTVDSLVPLLTSADERITRAHSRLEEARERAWHVRQVILSASE